MIPYVTNDSSDYAVATELQSAAGEPVSISSCLMNFNCRRAADALRRERIANEDESENYFFTFEARSRTTRGEFTIRAHVSRTLESITTAELARINFHNIWQVDTPREETDPASGNDHSPFVLRTTLRDKCRLIIIIMLN